MEWCRAFIEDADRLLQAIEKDSVEKEVGPYTARLLKLFMDKSLIQAAVHETFTQMRRYGESLGDTSPKESEGADEEASFTIKEKAPPVGEYFQK